ATFNLSPSELDILYPNELLAEHLDKKGIIYVDVTSCLNQRTGLYYKMDDHFTAAGHRVVADCIQHDSKWASIIKKGMGGNH
ncbi:MAG TPA: hypothetical protein VLH08_13385, partial [Acidobacteriota bacterium]|nr:hypothetical protein [Acidobacteriota bacterium]